MRPFSITTFELIRPRSPSCPLMPGPRTLLSPLAAAAALLAAGCWSAAASRESADAQVYPILDQNTRGVTGLHNVFPLERPVDTLRHRLLEGGAPVQLSLIEALDVAAENSRDFQRQKEQLYLVALDLTRNQHDFQVQFAGGGN